MLVDLETNPALTPYENDQLVEVVLDYLHRIGRDSGIFTGYERSDDERRKDIGDFLVVRRGETWEQRRSEIPVIDETPLGLPRARRP
ncbi:MAG TPA: hypothetical protein VD838_20725 [Anaeromyxobacteraceae bacterium]|nr:hypothetical protein [Anaeromyxobacteraceae bacterium]